MKEDELYVKANSLDYSEIREADDNYDDASQRKGEVLSLADKTWEQLTDRENDSFIRLKKNVDARPVAL